MQPTTRCKPLSCTYCYLPFRKVDNVMPLGVAEAVAASVNPWAAAAPGFEVVWHGGEPLACGRDHLRRLMEPFHGVKHSVQTNAVLLDDAWCDFLLDHDVHVGVSIDGPEHLNTHRATSAGHPAYRVIMRGIERLKRHRIPFSAIAVVSDPRPEQAAEFYEFFVNLGCGTLGVNVEEEEGVNTVRGTYDRERARDFWTALTAAWQANPVVQVREISRVLAYAGAVLEGAGTTGPAALPWDPLPTVAYDGGVILVSPELAGFTDARFGDFTTGNVLDTPLSVLLAEADQRTSWLPEFWQGVDSCQAECRFFDFCGGAHPANRYFEHGGRMDGTRTRYCTTAKIALLEGVTRHAQRISR
ncbi:cyclophane-forming radical SAM peptide maturase AmcB [Streptomyces sp. NPDC090085]|uniref:cyclophane-forming radical SAM peptide maturase AmcB n=1 Tax=Streptomyces sp. NPDC090085 TaxID=3365943 RepID=UPI0038118F08